MTTAQRHPLAPLSAAEIRRVRAIVLASDTALADDALFASITLLEPAKELVVGRERLDGVAREALAVLVRRSTGALTELRVSLTDGAVTSVTAVPGAHAQLLPSEYDIPERAAKGDPRFVAALARRGIEDLDRVRIDPVMPGHEALTPGDRRVAWAVPYAQDFVGDNHYAHPIENVRACVDLLTEEVVHVVDGDVIPVPSESGNFRVADVGPLRDDLKPLEITQPEGPSFTIEDGELRWQRWRFHVSLQPLGGLTFHGVRYQDGDRERSILYRAGLSEMVVPYGDPHEGFHWRNYFDAGEGGLGTAANSLTLGCDCLGEIRYLDADLAGPDGEPQTIANAICVHEEDYGLLWKHHDWLGGATERRRSRRLVVSSIATLGNYDYGFFWSFYLDGTIECEIKLTGIVLTKAVPAGERDPHGGLVAPQLVGPNHQHLFNVRLDFAVDGVENSVYEYDVVAAAPGPDNPYDSAVVTRSTLIEREADGRRMIDPLASRAWKVVNRAVHNRLGEPVAYKLVPHNGPVLLAGAGSPLARRAGFAAASLWVTRFAADELAAAGPYPNMDPGPMGLPKWVEQDRELVDADVVLWHTLGASHGVRPEDWPVMPIEHINFMLKPLGFFDANPSLDVPPPAEHRACDHH